MSKKFSVDSRIVISGLLSAIAFSALMFVIPLQEKWSQLYRVPFFELPLRGLLIALLLFALLPLVYLFRKRGTINWQKNSRLIWIFTVTFCGIFILLPVLGSEDIFLYIAQGRLAAVWNHNPYLVAPGQVPQDMIYPFVYSVWRSWPAVYGPFWLLIESFLAGLLPQLGVSSQVMIFRIFMAVAHIMTVILLQKFLRKKQIENYQVYTLLYAWNPLILFEVVNNAHNEGVIVLLLLASLLFLHNKKYATSAAVLTLAGLIKYSFLLLLPFWFLAVWRRSHSWKDLIRSLACAALVTLLLFLPWWAGADTFQGFLLHSSFVNILNAPFFLDIVAISALLLGYERETSVELAQFITRTLFIFSYILIILWQYFKKWPLSSALTALLAIILLFLTPNIHPWYYLWFLPLLLLQKKLPWFWLLTVLGISNYLFVGFINAMLLVLGCSILLSFLYLQPFSSVKKKQ